MEFVDPNVYDVLNHKADFETVADFTNLKTALLAKCTDEKKVLVNSGFDVLSKIIEDKNETLFAHVKKMLINPKYASEGVLVNFISSKSTKKIYDRINLFLLMDCYDLLDDLNKLDGEKNKSVNKNEIEKLVDKIIDYIYPRLEQSKPGFNTDEFLKNNNLIAPTLSNYYKELKKDKNYQKNISSFGDGSVPNQGGKKSKRRKSHKKPKKRSRKTRKC